MNTLPDIKKDFSGWYNEVIYHAKLVDQSPVRGCMVIRPYGFAIWENIRDFFDARIKKTGHQNAAFPLLIPQSFLSKEADHVEGFAPELAVVTHAGGKLLDEPLVVRPTSETIIHYMFAQWIKSWRDLPLKINQWANVVRWEMRTRPFLRTTEFFWQEGHTAHATRQEAEEEVQLMLKEYVNLAENYLAVPVVTGLKSDTEKFPGAEQTFTFEGLMPDGKALQMGTSHLLSQSFAHAFEMRFQDKNGTLQYPYLTSWGTTTRLIGAMVMVHGDQKGLVIPPRVAPIQVVIIPIFKKDTDSQELIAVTQKIASRLIELGVRCQVDDDQNKTPGSKFYEWELKGIPLRIELGMRDVASGQVVLVNRATGEKQSLALDTVADLIPAQLENLHTFMFDAAKKRRDEQWHKAAKLVDFAPLLDEKPGFYQTGWCGAQECEQQLKQYKATTRCLLTTHEFPTCFHCQNASAQDVLVAKSY